MVLMPLPNAVNLVESPYTYPQVVRSVRLHLMSVPQITALVEDRIYPVKHPDLQPETAMGLVKDFILIREYGNKGWGANTISYAGRSGSKTSVIEVTAFSVDYTRMVFITQSVQSLLDMAHAGFIGQNTLLNRQIREGNVRVEDTGDLPLESNPFNLNLLGCRCEDSIEEFGRDNFDIGLFYRTMFYILMYVPYIGDLRGNR